MIRLLTGDVTTVTAIFPGEGDCIVNESVVRCGLACRSKMELLK